MQIFIEAIDLNIWEAIEIGPFIPTMVVGNATIEKPREEWDTDEIRKVQYNLKAKNITIHPLTIFLISTFVTPSKQNHLSAITLQ